MLWQLSAALIGFIGGLFSGFFGIGGASITSPLLRIFLGVDGHVAIGTSLTAVIPAALAGAYVFYRKGLLKIRTIVSCGLVGALFSLFGAYLTLGFSGDSLMLALAGFLVLSSAMLQAGGKLHGIGAGFAHNKYYKALCSLFIGMTAGIMSGFLGVGGGFAIVPLLVILRGLPLKQAMACSLGIICLCAIPGALAHIEMGHVDAPLLILLLIGQIAGGIIGARCLAGADEARLKRAAPFVFALLGMALAIFVLLEK